MKISCLLLRVVAVVFIVLGALHLDVHYRILVPDTATTLPPIGDLDLGGITGNVYKMWQGFSFMMGICFIAIGLLIICWLRSTDDHPPVSIFFVMIGLLSAITYSGYAFFAAPQLYGGLGGILLLIIALFFTRQRQNHPS